MVNPTGAIGENLRALNRQPPTMGRMAKPDSVRDLIRRRLVELRLNMREVSLQLGKNHAYLQQFLERNIPVELPERVRLDLAGILQVEEAELRHGAAPRPRPPVGAGVPSTAERIPVLGSAEGGEDGQFPFNGEIIEYVPRPPELAGVVNAYAIYVAGGSMEPRYHPGELLYVHPGRPVTPGSYVLVQFHSKDEEPPRAMVKRLVRRSGTKVVFEQFEPPKRFDMDARTVISIHRIVGSGEA